MSYNALADTIVEVGYVYTYSTFFMNNGTYKSLINNGRIQRFPLRSKKKSKTITSSSPNVCKTTIDWWTTQPGSTTAFTTRFVTPSKT